MKSMKYLFLVLAITFPKTISTSSGSSAPGAQLIEDRGPDLAAGYAAMEQMRNPQPGTKPIRDHGPDLAAGYERLNKNYNQLEDLFDAKTAKGITLNLSVKGMATINKEFNALVNDHPDVTNFQADGLSLAEQFKLIKKIRYLAAEEIAKQMSESNKEALYLLSPYRAANNKRDKSGNLYTAPYPLFPR